MLNSLNTFFTPSLLSALEKQQSKKCLEKERERDREDLRVNSKFIQFS